MLSTSPYRDVKVIDVARMAGTSPATFYQYFPDVEGAVLEIADNMAREGAGLKDLVADKSWAGKTGYRTAEELVDGFLAFWRDNEAILRVVTLGSAEGDKRFFKIRMKILNAVTNSLTDSLKALQAANKADASVNAAAVAGSLVADVGRRRRAPQGLRLLGRQGEGAQAEPGAPGLPGHDRQEAAEVAVLRGTVLGRDPGRLSDRAEEPAAPRGRYAGSTVAPTSAKGGSPRRDEPPFHVRDRFTRSEQRIQRVRTACAVPWSRPPPRLRPCSGHRLRCRLRCPHQAEIRSCRSTRAW